VAGPLRRILVAIALIVAGSVTGMGAGHAAASTTHINHTHATPTKGLADWWW